MITIESLNNNFFPVTEIKKNIIKCADELSKTTVYTYFIMCDNSNCRPFVISDNNDDDIFAEIVLERNNCILVQNLTKVELSHNSYGFSHVLYAPFQYHSELKGRFDNDRENTVLCIPIFNAEFSGMETPEEFIELRRSLVATNIWKREISPKISLRFNNPKTKSGTGEGYVFVKFQYILLEIRNLIGVNDGFIEIINYKMDTIEILFNTEDHFYLIKDHDDSKKETVEISGIPSVLWDFLTA